MFTMAMIAILLGAVGLVTAAAAIEITNQSVDSNLHTASENMLIALAPTPTPTPPPSALPAPTPSETPEPSESAEPTSGDGSENEGEGEGGGSRQRTPSPAPTPSPTPTPTPSPSPSPTPSPSPSPSPSPAPSPSPTDQAERPPESSDTFFLILDTAGQVIANPQNVPLTDLPNAEAAARAASGREDLRTVIADGIRVRLLSEPRYALDGSIDGVLQSGFVLTGHDEQQALILRTILIASLVGLLGAALVTLFVTRRAMAPIRTAFDAERRFVAAASHELRTPVAVVRASAEILQREQLVRPEGSKLVEDVIAESDRLGRLVGDLLALASAEAGQISINPTLFDLRLLAADVVARVAGIAADGRVRVEAVQQADPVGGDDQLLVEADRDRMFQLLMIFVDNAIDHSPPEGVVRIVVRSDGPPAQGRAIIDVLDQGPGIPFELREQIFEPFAKVAGRRRTTGTTGLGLAIARILATRQGAELNVGDAPGGGARFSVALPRRPRETPSATG
jgi:signal transduction histidine kinase